MTTNNTSDSFCKSKQKKWLQSIVLFPLRLPDPDNRVRIVFDPD